MPPHTISPLKTVIPVKTADRLAMVRRIDELIEAKIRLAGYSPAAQSNDEEFLRRVYLDLTGVIPRVAEVVNFWPTEAPNKRATLIDKLLDSPAHATHLANTWRNILLPGGLNPEQINNVVGVQNWLRQRFVENVRYDNLVSDCSWPATAAKPGRRSTTRRSTSPRKS